MEGLPWGGFRGAGEAARGSFRWFILKWMVGLIKEGFLGGFHGVPEVAGQGKMGVFGGLCGICAHVFVGTNQRSQVVQVLIQGLIKVTGHSPSSPLTLVVRVGVEVALILVVGFGDCEVKTGSLALEYDMCITYGLSDWLLYIKTWSRKIIYATALLFCLGFQPKVRLQSSIRSSADSKREEGGLDDKQECGNLWRTDERT